VVGTVPKTESLCRTDESSLPGGTQTVSEACVGGGQSACLSSQVEASCSPV
jgi:hypothetical protein